MPFSHPSFVGEGFRPGKCFVFFMISTTTPSPLSVSNSSKLPTKQASARLLTEGTLSELRCTSVNKQSCPQVVVHPFSPASELFPSSWLILAFGSRMPSNMLRNDPMLSTATILCAGLVVLERRCMNPTSLLCSVGDICTAIWLMACTALDLYSALSGHRMDTCLARPATASMASGIDWPSLRANASVSCCTFHLHLGGAGGAFPCLPLPPAPNSTFGDSARSTNAASSLTSPCRRCTTDSKAS
mmetsp:Transcript_2009/g.12825  ORF Transcript_2009/g.12825 Transcript_2009/m.12825 type:complete len:244 (-) Transcript_2009:384-1115(-)